MLRYIALLSAVSPAFAQSIRYEVPEKPWSSSQGSHRAVVKVEKEGVVKVHLDWRRRDPGPEKKGVVVISAASGKQVADAASSGVTPESGDVFFRADAPGEYFVHFLAGNPGGGAFPEAKYVPAVAPAGALAAPTTEGKVLRWEARTEHDRFNEMEIIATKAEREQWTAKNPGAPFFVFPEVRERSTRMFDHVPEVWLKREAAPAFAARINEFYPFQLGVWAARGELKNLNATFSDFQSTAGAKIPGSLLRCLQTSGTDWDGSPITRKLNVAQGRVQPLWCALDAGMDVAPGTYTGTAKVTADGAEPQTVKLTFEITGPALADRGDSEPARMSKLRWLDSNIANDDQPTRLYTPLKVAGQKISLLGRSLTLAENGLPQNISSYFHPGVTRLVDKPTEMLTSPMRFVIELADGTELSLKASGFKITKANEGAAEWVTTLAGGDVKVELHGRLEFDGNVQFRTVLTATKNVAVKDVRLEIPRTADTSSLILGLGHYGGKAPASLDWKWDTAKKHQDAIWLGCVNAGLRVQLRAENYERPYVNTHYVRKPLNAPPSWQNGGLGGVRYKTEGSNTPLVCFSGQRTLEPGKPLHFDFDMSITPFHTLNTKEQWKDRYYHVSGVTEPAKIKPTGANVVNIHQGNHLNPYINYPFLTAAKLAEYAKGIHEQGMRVKYYYTVRELSNWTPELYAVQAFGDEILGRGKGGGSAWCEEHLGGEYWQAWAEPSVNDSSVLTATRSRWNNFYLQGLDWLIKNAGCDGLYLDDISYDRVVSKRARKILDRDPALNARGGGLVDLHSWNEIGFPRAGHASCALIFMESLPFVDRMWFGESHHYDNPADVTLTAISGIPFGLMGEMLEHGGNPWLGLPFGMTARLGWAGHPKPVWKLWDDFGVGDSEFIGWWDSTSPVRAEAPEVKATIWKKNGQTLVALGNYGDKPAKTKLSVDWKALGLDRGKVQPYAPAIEKFQSAALFDADSTFDIAPKRGLVLWLDEKRREAPAPVTTLSTAGRAVLLDERFPSASAADWEITAADRNAVRAEGGALVIKAPANAHAWAGRAVPAGTRIIAAQIRQESDKGQQWGPGLALVWSDNEYLKVNLREGGNYSVSVNGDERLVGHKDSKEPSVIAVALDDDQIRIFAFKDDKFQGVQELGSVPRSSFNGSPKQIRLGKMPNTLKPANHGTLGEVGQSRVDWLRVWGK